MKTIYIILIFACAFLALYEQSLQKPNVLIMVPAIVIFIVGLMRIMSKVPSKYEREQRDQREREEWEKQQQNDSDEV